MSSSLKIKKINDFKVSKIRLPEENKSNKKIRGGELLPLYSNTFICAKKNSGKTTVIFNILKKCVDQDTKLFFFVSTIEKDRSWRQIVRYFENKGVEVHSNVSTKSDDGSDLIQDILDTPVEFSDDEESSSTEEEEVKFISIDSDDEEKVKKKRKKRKSKIAQKQIIVLDDIGMELKKPSIDQLLKVNRHLKSKVILSSQYLNDLSCQARRQIDIWLLFNGCKKEKIQTIMRDCDTHLNYNKFEEIYKFSTREKYNFLFIDAHNCKFRKNFNQEIVINETT